MSEQDQAQEEANTRGKLLVINAARLAGAIMIALGLAIIVNRFQDLPMEIGYFLFAMGVFEFVVVPLILARKWKAPKP
jgi:hypothetical protein